MECHSSRWSTAGEVDSSDCAAGRRGMSHYQLCSVYTVSSSHKQNAGAGRDQELDLSSHSDVTSTVGNIGAEQLVHIASEPYDGADKEDGKLAASGSSQRLTHLEPPSPNHSDIAALSPHSHASSYASTEINTSHDLLMDMMINGSPWQQSDLSEQNPVDSGQSVEFDKQNFHHDQQTRQVSNDNTWQVPSSKGHFINSAVHKLSWRLSPCQQQPQQPVFPSQQLADGQQEQVSGCATRLREGTTEVMTSNLQAPYNQSVFNIQRPDKGLAPHAPGLCLSGQYIMPGQHMELQAEVTARTVYQQQRINLSNPRVGHLQGAQMNVLQQNSEASTEACGTGKLGGSYPSGGGSHMKVIEPNCDDLAKRHAAMKEQIANAREILVRGDSYFGEHSKENVAGAQNARQTASKTAQSGSRLIPTSSRAFRNQPFRFSMDSAYALKSTLTENLPNSFAQNSQNRQNPVVVQGEEKIKGPKLSHRAIDNLLRRQSSYHMKSLQQSTKRYESSSDKMPGKQGENALNESQANLESSPYANQNDASPKRPGFESQAATEQSSPGRKRLQFGRLTPLTRKRPMPSDSEVNSNTVVLDNNETANEKNGPDAAATTRPSEDPVTTTKKQRFLKTAQILEKSGLMDITLKTASMLQNSHRLQTEIDKVRAASKRLLISILTNLIATITTLWFLQTH